jgi:hypothetical protein
MTTIQQGSPVAEVVFQVIDDTFAHALSLLVRTEVSSRECAVCSVDCSMYFCLLLMWMCECFKMRGSAKGNLQLPNV